MKCIKCEGALRSEPGKPGFRCGLCGSHFYDFGRIGGAGQTLDLSRHSAVDTLYRCPVDRESLRRYVINGLEFEYCPSCRHVWLDRREAEELSGKVALDRMTAHPAPDKPIDIPFSDRMNLALDANSSGLLMDALFSLIGAVGDW